MRKHLSRVVYTLVVVLLLASNAMPAVSAALDLDGSEFTETCKIHRDVKNLLQIDIGSVDFEGYFQYDHVNTPIGYITRADAHVIGIFDPILETEDVPYLNECKRELRALFEPTIHLTPEQLGNLSLTPIRYRYSIFCDKDGNTYTEVKRL